MSTPVLAARRIVKRFGGVTALNGVSFELLPGEVHALCGENGAGKSTLIKLLAGVHPSGSYEGELELSGRGVTFRSIRDAERAGIAVIYQELALFPQMTVAENLFLRRLPRRFGRIEWLRLRADARALLRELGIDLDPEVRVEELGIAGQQLVEIARALARRPQVLVLDEPTAALGRRESEVLLGTVRRLRTQGVACIFISHKLDEVFAIADRVTVLRDGATQGTFAVSATTPEQVIRAMVGRAIDDRYPRRAAAPGEVLLCVTGLSVAPRIGAAARLNDLSFAVAAGEVLGIGGLMGAGRSELLLHLVGQFGLRTSGDVELRGGHVPIRGAREALRAGLALVSEDRKRYGLVLDQGVGFNLTLAALAGLRRGPFIDRERERVAARDSVAKLQIRTGGLEDPVATLSGGNQQKVVIGKALLTNPAVLLLDEPTRGIDVGAKVEVYHLINELTSQGKAVVMSSSELPELLGMCDRIVMLHEGRVGGMFARSEATQEKLLAAAMGRLERAA